MMAYELKILLYVGRDFLEHVQTEVIENMPNYGFKVEIAKKLGVFIIDETIL